MSESLLKNLFKQVSMYLSSSTLVTIGGFITFPIWTRIFSEAEYGHMSLATATLALIIVFSKFGLQNAVLRFYSEFKENKRKLDISYYYTTGFVSVLIISVLISIIYLLVLEFLPDQSLGIELKKIMRILSLLIVFDAIISIFLMFLRAEQNAKFYSTTQVIKRYSTIVVTILFVIVFKFGLPGFFIGTSLVDGSLSVFLFLKFLKQGKMKFGHLSYPLFKEMLAYGLPLIGFELSALLLASGDRFQIQYFMGAAAVGLYSAAYNATTYFVDFFANSFRMAVMPIFMSSWEKNGKQETQQFLSSVVKLYYMIGIPIIFIVSFFRHDIIVLLASDKYEQSCVIMPFVIIGYIAYKANFLYGAGLYLKKKTTTLLFLNFSAALLNIVLNLVMIPLIGILGAAIATLVAYVFEVIMVINIAFRTVSIKLPYFAILKYASISILMVAVMYSVNNLGSLQIIIRVIIGILIYGSGILLIESGIRTRVGILINRIAVK